MSETLPSEGATIGPTLDSELYNCATHRIETRCENKINQALDTQGLATWFGEQLRHAYETGLRDGYTQGRHDRHRANGDQSSP